MRYFISFYLHELHNYKLLLPWIWKHFSIEYFIFLEEESISELSTIYPPSTSSASTISKITSELSQNNMTVLDASVLSPMIRRVMQEQQDQFMQRLEQTILQKKVKR